MEPNEKVPGKVYFFGLIDTLQKFTMRKWLEKKIKRSTSSLFSTRPVDSATTPLLTVNEIESSVEEPIRYASRLLKFFSLTFV